MWRRYIVSVAEPRQDGDLMMSKPIVEKYSPEDIADALARFDTKVYRPTPYQRAVISIESNPLAPAVVIAGAGSGKTETMAARVIYLVANGFVQPEHILGLTFTKKAAGELSHRIRKRLRQLKEAKLIAQDLPINVQVMTYHSYAANLLNTYGLREGIETDGTPMGEAASWQLAARIVRDYDEPDFTNENKFSTIVERVSDLAKLMLEHDISGDRITDYDADVLETVLAIDARSGGKSNKEARRTAQVLRQRRDIVAMAQRLIAARQEGENLTFDDQMYWAAKLATSNPEVGQQERSTFQVVLLDEYQDTSQSQIRMLSSLFGDGHPVMAVGDPYQAIYGWRGASAGTITSFHKDFPSTESQSRAQSQQHVFSLPTTFRNDHAILSFANIITDHIKSEELQARWKSSQIDVERLAPRDGAGEGFITIAARRSIQEEAQAIADFIAPHWNDPARLEPGNKSAPKSFAVLVRRRAQISAIDAALRAADIPVQIVGSSGLIYLPEVADIYTLMQVLVNPDAGAALMRHLTGPRIALGAHDIAALGAFSRERNRELEKAAKSDIASLVIGKSDVAEADDRFSGSLIDALDEIDQARQSDFSEAGFARLRQCAADLRRLRAHAARSITDFIYEIEDYLHLETQVMVHDLSPHARRNIDRFIEEAAQFERSGGTVVEFLDWLEVTSEEESGLKIGSVEVRDDVVQIMTVHTSKGAEWDLVCIPGLADEQFPSEYRSGEHWLGTESHIPFELRGDAKQLPPISFDSIDNNTALSKRVTAFKDLCKAESRLEELRLAYVAVTRARTHLYLSTSWWRDGDESKDVSDIFSWALSHADELKAVIDTDGEQPVSETPKPDDFPEQTALWPIDHLGNKRGRFDAAVALLADVHSYEGGSAESTLEPSWIEDMEALLLEREQYQKGRLEIELPHRLSTSTLIRLHENPEELALSIRRPMPRVMDEYAKRGTAFHAWIEKHFSASTLFDDDDLDCVDPLEEDQTLETLQSAWLASEWASKTPHKVEEGFEAIVGGILIRGRIDAIYKYGDGDDVRYEVIDWKTGSKTLGVSAAVQLAMYRLAWSRIAGVPLEQVSAAFHYVPTGVTDRRSDLMSEAELIALIQGR